MAPLFLSVDFGTGYLFAIGPGFLMGHPSACIGFDASEIFRVGDQGLARSESGIPRRRGVTHLPCSFRMKIDAYNGKRPGCPGRILVQFLSN
jgi:hypothetical protein